MFNCININNKKYCINDFIELKKTIVHSGNNEIITKGTIVKIENKYNLFKDTLITLYLADGFSDGDIRYTSFLKKFKLKDL